MVAPTCVLGKQGNWLYKNWWNNDTFEPQLDDLVPDQTGCIVSLPLLFGIVAQQDVVGSRTLAEF